MKFSSLPNKKNIIAHKKAPISATKAASVFFLGTLIFSRGIGPILQENSPIQPPPPSIPIPSKPPEPPENTPPKPPTPEPPKTPPKPLVKHSFRFCPDHEKDFHDLDFLLEGTLSFRKDGISGFLISLLAPTVLKAIADVEWSPEMSTNSIVATTGETTLKTLVISPHAAANIFSIGLTQMASLEERAMNEKENDSPAEHLCIRIKEHVTFWNKVITDHYSDLAQKDYLEKLKLELDKESKFIAAEIKKHLDEVSSPSAAKWFFSVILGQSFFTEKQKDFIMKKVEPNLANQILHSAEDWEFLFVKGLKREFGSEEAFGEFYLPFILSNLTLSAIPLAARLTTGGFAKAASTTRLLGHLGRVRHALTWKNVGIISKRFLAETGKKGFILKGAQTGKFVIAESGKKSFFKKDGDLFYETYKKNQDHFSGDMKFFDTMIQQRDLTSGLYPDFQQEMIRGFLEGKAPAAISSILSKPNMGKYSQDLVLEAISIRNQLLNSGLLPHSGSH